MKHDVQMISQVKKDDLKHVVHDMRLVSQSCVVLMIQEQIITFSLND